VNRVCRPLRCSRRTDEQTNRRTDSHQYTCSARQWKKSMKTWKFQGKVYSVTSISYYFIDT
jgi:hypothetical protein